MNLSFLLKELDKYPQRTRQAADDPVLAAELAERCRQLLLVPTTNPAVAQLIRATAEYLLEFDDAQSDIMSMVGQQDDLALVRAVERIVGIKPAIRYPVTEDGDN